MQKSEKKEDVGLGSFCVPRRAIQEIFKHKVDVNTVLAYLIIAVFTDEKGTSSRAGAKSIIERLGLRKELTEAAIAKLVSINLLIDHRGEAGSRIEDPKAVRFTVPDFDEPLEQRIWFGKSIVEMEKVGNIQLCRPMRALKDAKIECIHLLLWMHSIQDKHYLSARPLIAKKEVEGIFVRYSFDGDQDSNDEYETHRIQIAHSPELEWHGFPYSARQVTAALAYLKIHGFAYEVIMAFNRELVPESDCSEETYLAETADPIFHLHGKLSKAVLPKEELGVSHLTLKMAQAEGFETFEKDGTLDNRYVVISQPGTDLGVAGIFRLRHRVRNVANFGVGEPWARLMDSEREYRNWLVELMSRKHCLSVENLKQHKEFNEKQVQVAARKVERSMKRQSGVVMYDQ
jgi:hypothetical protein